MKGVMNLTIKLPFFQGMRNPWSQEEFFGGWGEWFRPQKCFIFLTDIS